MEWVETTPYPRRRIPAGMILFQEGDVSDLMYFVISGRLQITKQVIEGADKVLTCIDAGHYVGEMGLLTGAMRSATVMALVDTEVIELDQEAFMALLHDYPHVGVDLMQQMARHLETTNEELILLALEVALAQRKTISSQPERRGMCFVATGSFAHEHTTEVMRIAYERARTAQSPALSTALVRPGRSHEALVYIIETDAHHDLVDFIAPFAGLVQWDISPALDIREILPGPTEPNG